MKNASLSSIHNAASSSRSRCNSSCRSRPYFRSRAARSDDQREVHRQIFEGEETIDYAFMGQDPDAADNRWLREAFENQIPIIYFLGIAPGRYQAAPSVLPRSRYHGLQWPLRAVWPA